MSGHTKPKMKRMRIYFDGCAKTGGYSRTDRIDRRYPKLLCEKLGAEEYNLAQRNGSNKRIVRNLLDHDLSQYDLFVIQMTKKNRFEYFDKNKKIWISVGHQVRELPQKISGLSKSIHTDFVTFRRENEKYISLHTKWRGDIISLNDVPSSQRPHKEEYKFNNVSDDRRSIIEYYLHYYRYIYSEEQGRVEEQMCFSTIKTILKNHKHIIIYMHSDKEVNVPVDLIYKKGKDYVHGWYMGADTHEIILNDIENLL